MSRPAATFALLHALFAGLVATVASAAPVITGLSPSPGPAAGGVPMTIIGSGFFDARLTPTVWFGGREVSPSDVTPTTVMFDLPAARLRRVEVLRVDLGGEQSNEVPFEYAPPAVTGFSGGPSPRSGGMLLTVTGSNFTGAFPRVSFEGLGALRPVSATDGELVVSVPPSSLPAPVPVHVVSHGDSGLAGSLTYEGPHITSVVPATVSAAGGTVITINGSGFDANMRVRVNDLEARLKSIGLLQATVVTPPLPPGTGPVTVEVCASGACSNAYAVAGDRTPIIRGLALAEGRMSGGFPITIRGASLAGVKSVSFGGAPVAPTEVADDHVVFEAPPSSAGDVDVSVSDGSVSSAPATFGMRLPPSIQGVVIDHPSRLGGGVITIVGENFGSSQDAMTRTVSVGGTEVGPVRWMSPEVLRVTAPPGPLGPADVSISVHGVPATLSGAFAYTDDPAPSRPVIDSIVPSAARALGGTTITIFGSGFSTTAGATSVRLRPHPNLVPLVGSATELQFTVPPGVPGDSMWVVVESDGAASPPSSFRYELPLIESIAPAGGSYAGGDLITIVGRDFTDPEVLADGVNLLPVHATSDTVIVNAVASDSAKGSESQYRLKAGFLYAAEPTTPRFSPPIPYPHTGPRVDSMSESALLAGGGMVITIRGVDFSGAGLGHDAFVGRWKAPELNSTSDQIVVTVPPRNGSGGGHAGGGGGGAGGMLRVLAGGLPSNGLPFDWVGPTITEVSPSAGRAAGGTHITLHGFGFTDRSSVAFGTTEVPIEDAGPDFITCTSPPGSGAQEVTVTEDGLPALSSFTFLSPPAVGGVEPVRGPLAGGTLITIVGSHFGAPGDGVQRSVTVGGVECPDLGIAPDGSLTCLSPPAAGPGPAEVTVTIDGVSHALANGYWYTDALDAGPVRAPARFALSIVGANPARGATRLRLALPSAGHWALDLMDVTGQRVHRLEGDSPAGVLDLAWDGRGTGGRQAAPGLYFARATCNGVSASQRVVRID